MFHSTFTALAHPNIAFIKYWGNRDNELRLPVNGSISMNLAGLQTVTTVTFDSSLQDDQIILNGQTASPEAGARVTQFLDRVRGRVGLRLPAAVTSRNNFPSAAGIASSAAGFAALSVAATNALGLGLDEAALSRLARTGSGSACRSIPAGFTEWMAGSGDADSYAVSIAPPGHWDLVDCIAVVSGRPKAVGSSAGHRLAASSILQNARVADAPRRLDLCRQAILQRDFSALAEVVELDSNLMHAVMQTSTPTLLYWEPATLAVMRAVMEWRASGRPVAYTIDAGPNIHVITLGAEKDAVAGSLQNLPGVEQVYLAGPGDGAYLVSGA